MIVLSVGGVLAAVSVLVRATYIAEFVSRSPSLLPWIRAALALDAGVLVAWVIVNHGMALGWLPVVLWLAVTCFDLGYLLIGRRMLRLDSMARQEREQAELIAALPRADQAWVREHMDLATIRLRDRVEARR